MGQGICLCGNPQGVIVDMGVDLRGIQVVVAQDFLNGPDVHTVLQHQRGGGVAQLVGGVFALIDSSGGEALFDHGVNGGPADPFIPGGEKEGVGVPADDGTANGQIALQGVLTGVIQIKNSNLIAFAQNPQGIVLNIPEV